MRRGIRRKIIPLALALALAMVGAALAVPTINMTVQELGQGQATIHSNIKHAKITWNLDKNNPDYLNSTYEVTVDLSNTSNTIENGGTIYVKLYDDSNNLVAKGSVTLSNTTQVYNVDLIPVDGPSNRRIGLEEFGEVYVVYKGP